MATNYKITLSGSTESVEGTQTFTVSVRTVSTSGAIVATSSTISINDTSLTPLVTISPAFGGVTSFTPTASATLASTSCGSYSFTPNTTFTAMVKCWGAGGGGSVNNHHNVSSSSSNRHHTNAITTSNTLNQAINSLELLSDKSELSSKTNSFSSSSMSRASSSNEYHTTLRTTPHRSMTIDTGFRSISSDFDIKGSVGYESFEEPPMPSSSIKQIINATNKSNLTTTGSFNSNDLTVTASSASSLTSTNSAPTIKSKLENSNKQIN
jgi:hypothetical protein